MNVDQLNSVASEIENEFRERNIIATIQNLAGTLDHVVNQPQQPKHQQQVANLRKSLVTSLREAPSNFWSPGRIQLAMELGFADRIGAGLAERIESVFETNEITPAAASKEIKQLHAEASKYYETMKSITESFRYLEIGYDDLVFPEAELGILVPRSHFSNSFVKFSSELPKLNKIFLPYQELATGSRKGFELRSLSSTDPSVFLGLDAETIALIALALDKLISKYKEILEIKRLHGDLSKHVPEETLKPVKEYANSAIKESNTQLAEELVDEHLEGDDGRANELKTEVRRSLNDIAIRIDVGFSFTPRVGEPDEEQAAEEENAALVEAIAKLAKVAPNLDYQKLEGPPILSMTHDGNDSSDRKEMKGKKGTK